MAKRFGKGLSTNKGWGAVGTLHPTEIYVKSKISMELENLGAKVGSETMTLNSIINSPSLENDINRLKSRLYRLKTDKVKEYEGYGEQIYNEVIESDTFKYGDLTKTDFKKLTKSIGKGNSIVGEKILEDLKPSQIEKYLKRPSVSDDMKKQLLELLGTKTSMGYTRATYHTLQEEDYEQPAPYGLKKDGTPKQKPGRKPKPKEMSKKKLPKPKEMPKNKLPKAPNLEFKDIEFTDIPEPKNKREPFKNKVDRLKKEREEAPYGRKKDGTPKQKPGPKPRTPEQREIDKAFESVVDKFVPGFINSDKLLEDIEKGYNRYNKWAEHTKDVPKITPEQFVEMLDYSPEKIAKFGELPPTPGQTPKEVYKEREKERNEKPINPEDIEKAKALTPREKNQILEKLESGEDLDDEFIDWLERKLRRRIKPLPNFDDLNYSPEDWIKRAYAHSTDKDKVATENWFKCARIEFGLNVPRLPVLIELAKRVADEDPNLLFEPRTEINLWYNVWGWQRADDLISNLESVSGLRADESIKAYEDVDERNEKIRRYYANRLRYNLRQDLIDQGWTDRKERDKKLAQMMRERGYKY